MDRASPYSNAFRRAPLLNFIVTTRIIRIPYLDVFAFRIDVSRSFFAKETKIFSEEKEKEVILDLVFDSVKYNKTINFLLCRLQII